MSHELLILSFSEKVNCQDHRKYPNTSLGSICCFSHKNSQITIWYLAHANGIASSYLVMSYKEI